MTGSENDFKNIEHINKLHQIAENKIKIKSFYFPNS
jgi:hypothetical protein